MKKKIISIISIILLVTMLFACAPSVEQVEIPKEILQEYIYELAVKEGYEGAYDEWLDSIRGEAGRDGRNVELSTTPTHIVWRYEDSTEWKTLVALDELEGTDGKSAYELAKDYGYKGTIEEWLESLKGTNGTNGTNGVDGKQIELSTNTTHIVWKYTEDSEWNNLVSLELLKGATTSITGAAGKSAYEIAVDLGYEGTVNEWIESLKGQNGHTPVITIKDGYWYVDGVSTNVKAEGKDGNGILNFELSKQDGLKDTYTITFTDNTTKEFTVTNGKDGVDGVSISNVDLTSEGNLEVTLSSGITLNLGKVKGEDGIDGTSIKEANINTDGHLILTLTDESEINVGKIVGDKGDQGLNGIGIKSIAFDSDNNLIITLTDNTEVNCGKVPTCNHIFSEWTNEIKATCTSIGVDTRECTICEMKDYRFTEELDHKFNEWSTLVSTCTEHKESRTCSECNKVELRDGEINKDNHNFNNGICDNCGESNALSGMIFTLLEDDTYELTSCKSLANFIEIPSTYEGKKVTRIGEGAFRNNVLLYNVVIPDTIVSLGADSFRNCINLLEINIPSSVVKIGSNAFTDCTCVEKVTIPFVGSSLENPTNTKFGYIFGYTESISSSNDDYVPTSLKEVIITGGTSIYESAFSSCISIKSIKIADSVTSIGKSAFYYCKSLKKVELGSSIEEIGENAFNYLNFSSDLDINLSKLIDVYYKGTIEDWCNINFMNYRSNPMNQGKNFYMLDDNNEYYDVKEIEVPESIVSMNNYTFVGFRNLTKITIPFVGESLSSTNKYFGYIFGAPSSDKQKEYIPSSLSDVIILGGNGLSASAFKNCSNIKKISMPKSFNGISSGALYGCESLEELTLPFVGIDRNATGYNALFGIIFGYSTSDNGLYDVWQYYYFSSYKGNYYYYAIPETLKKVTVTDATTLYGLSSGGDKYAGAFLNCGNIEEIILNEGITEIGPRVFEKCTSITSIDIPDSVTSIGDLAFYGCTNLKTINVSDNNEYYKSIDGNLYTKDGKILLQYIISNTATYFAIPDTVTTIKDSAFRNCKKLKNITIPNSVVTIEQNAFYDCTGLIYVSIPSSVKTIGTNAFFNNKYPAIYVSASSKPSGWDANWAYSYYPVYWGRNSSNFFEENGIQYVLNTSSKVAKISKYVGSDSEIIIPENITFNDVVYNVTTIADYGFCGCTTINKIEILNNITTIGKYAFSSCKNLTIYCETTSKPDGWNSNWNSSNCPVVWDYKNLA